MSLRKQAISGVIWTILDSFFLRALSFIATIILARWLGPDDFGLLGMITIFIAIGTSITDSGLSSSLIRTKNADEEDFSTVFLLNLLFSGIVYLIIFLGAPYIADFFNQPILKNIVRVYCTSFIISGFSAVQLARLNSTMQFKKITQYNIPGIVISTILGLLLGYFEYGVWALVWMYLSNQLIKTMILWISSGWKPKIKFSKEKAKYHYSFGYRLMLSGLLNTFFQYIYNIVIGKFYTVKDLGFYERSRSLNDYPVQTLTTVVSKVTYPLLVNVKEDKEKISNIYKKILGLTFFITAPLMFGASAVALPLFRLILGDQWLGAVPYFQILCLAGMFYPIHAFNLNVYQVFGRSDLFLKIEIIKKIIIVLGILVGMQFGIMGLVWSSVITNYIALYVNTYYSKDMINYKAYDQFKDLIPTFILGTLMFLLIKFSLFYLINYSLLVQILLAMIIGVGFYVISNLIFKNKTLKYIIHLSKEKFKFT